MSTDRIVICITAPTKPDLHKTDQNEIRIQTILWYDGVDFPLYYFEEDNDS